MNYYNEIKKELINNEINRKVKNYSINRSDLNTYYNVGKMLSDAWKHYGEGIIKEYSKRLTNDLEKKYNERTLRRIRQFYLTFKDEKWSTVSTKLSYSHYCEIMWLEELQINYYINITIKYNLSVRELRNKIKNHEYERLPDDTKNKLIQKEETNITDFIKNPIKIKNTNYEIITEKVLQKLILEDIPTFLEELGSGFTFIKNEYKIKLGNTYNYIDLLLFNYEYNCFVIVELKITELKKEHIGQIEVYMNYIDENIKKINHNKTIGIIICRENNKYIIKYCSDKRIITREYQFV